MALIYGARGAIQCARAMASVSRSAQPTLPSKGNGHTPDFMEQLIKTPPLIRTEPCMQTLHVNGYDMAYLEVGNGPPLVCVHGSLCDFRIWSCVLGALSRKHRVITVSLRHFFPEHWDGVGDTYSIAQHTADVIAFIEKLDTGPVDLMGHSRGGHISFRVAQQRPDLLRRLVLAEPGGDLDATLSPDGAASAPSPVAARIPAAVEKVRSGDVDGALELIVDMIDGDGT